MTAGSRAFDRKRGERLVLRGAELLDEQDYGGTLEVALELERLGNPAAYEIGARALAGDGLVEQALELLERGAEVADLSWTGWLLLGNLRSDLERYEAAEQAYGQALACPDHHPAVVLLNRGILLDRSGRHVEAVALLGRLHDDELRLPIAEARMRALYALGRARHAERLGRATLAAPAAPEDDDEIRVRIEALLERIRLDREASPTEIRRNALRLLARAAANPAVLELLRDTRARLSDRSHSYRLVLRGRRAEDEPAGGRGYYVSYQVVAEAVDEALELAREIEQAAGYVDLVVDEYTVLEPAAASTRGVYWYSDRVFFADEGAQPS